MKTNSDTTAKLYIGFDVHQEQTSVAIAEPGSNGEIRSHGRVATSQSALEKLLRRLMHHNKIKVAIARELTGVIWEIGFKMQSAQTIPT